MENFSRSHKLLFPIAHVVRHLGERGRQLFPQDDIFDHLA